LSLQVFAAKMRPGALRPINPEVGAVGCADARRAQVCLRRRTPPGSATA